MKLVRPLLLSLLLHLLPLLWLGLTAFPSRSAVVKYHPDPSAAPIHIRIDSVPTNAADPDRPNRVAQPGPPLVLRKAQKRHSAISSSAHVTLTQEFGSTGPPLEHRGVPPSLLPGIYPTFSSADGLVISAHDNPPSKGPAGSSASSETELNHLGRTTTAAVEVGELLASEMRINLDKLRFPSRDFVRLGLRRDTKCRLSIVHWHHTDSLLGAFVFESIRNNPGLLQPLCATNLVTIVLDIRFNTGTLYSSIDPAGSKEEISWNGSSLGINIKQPGVGEDWGKIVSIEPETMAPSLNVLGLALLPFESRIGQHEIKERREMLKRSLAYSNPEKLSGFVLLDR